MKIAFISLFKKDFGGGEGRAAYEMAQRFAIQHDVVLICPADRTALYLESGLRVFGIKSAGKGHICLPILSQKNVNRLFDFFDDFRPEIVHAHEPVSLGLIGQVWAKMHNVPLCILPTYFPPRSLTLARSNS